MCQCAEVPEVMLIKLNCRCEQMKLRTPREPDQDQDYDGTGQVFGRLIPTRFYFTILLEIVRQLELNLLA